MENKRYRVLNCEKGILYFWAYGLSVLGLSLLTGMIMVIVSLCRGDEKIHLLKIAIGILIVGSIFATIIIFIVRYIKKIPNNIIKYDEVNNSFVVFTNDKEFVEIKREDVKDVRFEIMKYYNRSIVDMCKAFGSIIFETNDGSEYTSYRINNVDKGYNTIIKNYFVNK